MNEFLEKIGIDDVGHYSDSGNYVIDIPDYDTYGKYYNKLSKSDELQEDEDLAVLSETVSTQTFNNENFQVTLTGNFDTDSYKMVVKEI